MKKINRRDFFKFLKVDFTPLSLFDDLKPALDLNNELLPFFISRVKETLKICNNCPDSCSFIVSSKNGIVQSIEANPDNFRKIEEYQNERCQDFLKNYCR